MSEFRLNIATNRWVIIAPGRGERPNDFEINKKAVPVPEHDDHCPFCPGNEDKLEEIIFEISEGESWRTRVVNNKFAALKEHENKKRKTNGLYCSMAGFGKQEVIVDSPKHNDDIAVMDREHTEAVIETYHRRYMDLMDEKENMLCIIFRNHGRTAGTSLKHPHSQLAITNIVPKSIRMREREAQRYFDKLGRCVFCDILKEEIKLDERLIYDNEYFAAFVPYFAEVPYETWIMPKIHNADFGVVSDGEKRSLADVLGKILFKIRTKLGNPDYNYIINSAAQYKAGEPQLHWYLQIKPRTTTPAGFEIGTGIPINPGMPEENAKELRI